MVVVSADRSSTSPLNPTVVFGVVAFALALRLVHLSSALASPLSYQPGPDEEYYLRFGQAVAAGQGQDAAEFTFMDPAYGYLLGAVFKVAGLSLFTVYALQCLVDTFTAVGILVIGGQLGRPRAGLYGALLYGVASTAIMFCTTMLKEVWVTAFMTWWVAGALAAIRSERKLVWLAFGVYCGMGIGLRSTLLLMALLALLLPGLAVSAEARSLSRWAGKAALIACGVAAAVLPWSLRNYHAYGGVSPLPHNGGVVLHQVYNANNPESAIWIPDFVSYLSPSEIWRGYAAEAAKREGRALSPPEVDQYWKAQALDYMRQNPGAVLGDMWRKALKFLSSTEIPINRSLAEESMFSPVLRWLPAPAAWLLAMGIAGLIGFSLDDRRWTIVIAPILISFITVVGFWAEDRFRLHCLPMLALCSGLWIERLTANSLKGRKLKVLVFGAAAALIGGVSVALGSANPPPPMHWDHVVWGYIKMGKITEARNVAERIAAEQPQNGPIFEALGFTDIARGQYNDAVRDYQRAIEARPNSHVAHYNLAKLYLKLGDRERAAAEAAVAVNLFPADDYKALLEQIRAPQQ
jgi:tetratricopeptide (TPR) repeat protein